MSNIVSFKIQIEGSDSIKTVTFSADELGKALNAVRDSSDRLSGSIVNWAQAGQAAEILGSIVSDLSSAFQDLSAAYAVQEAAETRLAQAMRNTMGATEEDIDSIKRLCSAQQQLGIIGDEVQLSGAQELATYLEKKSSLEQLIPVMNDMLAQQYEYNATAENAAQIASMLGKVMNGQTEALSRYGYKFDEAQKQILKFGTEEERAAVLAEVVQQSVGGMNEKLAQTPTGVVKQLSNWMGDLKEQVGGVATRILPVLQGMSSLTTTATGIGKLVTSVKSLTAALKAAGIGAKALRTAMAGVAGVALIGIITALGIMAKKTREAKEAAEKANEEYREMQNRLATARSEIEIDIQKLSSFNGSVAEQKRLVGEMNDKWGSTFGTFSTVAEWYKTLSENVDAYCTRLANQIELEKIANDVASAKNENRDLQAELKTTPKEITSYIPSGGGNPGYTGFKENPRIKEIEGLIKKNEQVILEGESRMKDLLAQIAANVITPGGGGGGGGGGNSGGSIETDIQKYRDSVQAAIDVNTAFNNGQDEFVAQANAMKSGLVSLIRQYGLENEEVQKLVKEYYDLRKAKMGAMLDVADTSHLNLPTTLSQPKESLKKPSGSDTNEDEKSTKNLISIQDAASGASSAVGALGDAMSGLSSIVGEGAAGWLTWGANLLKAISAALPQLAALFAGETAVAGAGAMSAVANIPYVGPILAIAALASIVAAAATLPKFAEGGLAYGPTLGIFGEYPGAANNPEVVAPLNKLRDIIEPSSGFGQVEFKIDGYVLKGILRKVNRLDYRNNG